MGGRGASSGVSNKGKKYGTEYTTLLQSENIKFIKQNIDSSIKAPMETMAKDRIYVTLGQENMPKAITFYDESGHRTKQIDITGKPHKINGKWVLPHAHLGYYHDEKGTYTISKSDKRLIDKVMVSWNNLIKGK